MKKAYRIRNWTEYDRGLKQRASLTFWFSEEALSNWLLNEKTGKTGASAYFCDQAFQNLHFQIPNPKFMLALCLKLMDIFRDDRYTI